MKRTNTNKLKALIEQYGKNKSLQDSLKKQVDADNAAIKAIMQEEDLKEYSSGMYKINYSVQHRETMDEDNLLLFLGKEFSDVCEEFGIIKTRQYVDFDALERAIYNDKFNKNAITRMDKFRSVTEIPTLKIKKIKEG